jgi:hypothetical protein
MLKKLSNVIGLAIILNLCNISYAESSQIICTRVPGEINADKSFSLEPNIFIKGS